MINVTRTLLPTKEDYDRLLLQIWDSKHLTNNGPLAISLEKSLSSYLQVPNLSFVSNGTIALQIAIKALDLKGEIITTPFSYVATTSAIAWEGCEPVFVDIDPKSFTINPELIEAAITPRTTAILATHVYGVPCDVEKIESIAKKYHLKVIYDAAHCFGISYKGRSILEYGDCSTLSFHATKIFHTCEGGAVICPDPSIHEKVKYLRNFGHNGYEGFHGIGINGKNSEFHAAMGLCVLPLVKNDIESRRQISAWYDKGLNKHFGDEIKRPEMPPETNYNYAYYPVFFKNEETLIRVKSALEAENIYPRRYFYPSLDTLNYVKMSNVPVAHQAAKTALCLPLYAELTSTDIAKITNIINNVMVNLEDNAEHK